MYLKRLGVSREEYERCGQALQEDSRPSPRSIEVLALTDAHASEQGILVPRTQSAERTAVIGVSLPLL